MNKVVPVNVNNSLSATTITQSKEMSSKQSAKDKKCAVIAKPPNIMIMEDTKNLPKNEVMMIAFHVVPAFVVHYSSLPV